MSKVTLPAPKATNWLTTFGDMLTLLLCFFLTTISLGALNPKNINPTAQPVENIKTKIGTSIALLSSEDLRSEILVSEGDYQNFANHRKPGLSELIKTAVDLEVYSIKSAVLETCYVKPESKEGESWHESMSRALALNSQLIDTKIVLGDVKTRAVGPWCSTLFESSNAVENESMTAKLIFELEEIKNG